MTPQDKIDEFIRDVTRVGSLPKSEVRRRLKELLAEEHAYDSAQTRWKESGRKGALLKVREKIEKIKGEEFDAHGTGIYDMYIYKSEVLSIINELNK